VTEVLKAAKWLLLLFLLCEAAALVLSILLRFVLAPPNAATAYNNFDEVRQGWDSWMAPAVVPNVYGSPLHVVQSCHAGAGAAAALCAGPTKRSQSMATLTRQYNSFDEVLYRWISWMA
jgi:hypothetical protein